MIICPPMPIFDSLFEQGYSMEEIVDMLFDNDSPLDQDTKLKLEAEIYSVPDLDPSIK